jgi:hypothetical protein
MATDGHDHTDARGESADQPLRGAARLSDHDAHAVDALFEHGDDPRSTSADLPHPATSARADRIVKLLRVLDAHTPRGQGGAAPHDRATRIDRVLQRVAHARGDVRDAGHSHVRDAASDHSPEHDDIALSDLDQEALEAYILAGYRTQRVASSLAPRAEKVEALVRLVTAATPHDAAAARRRATRIDETLEGVALERMRFVPLDKPRASGGMRWSDLVSVAAVLLIAGSILWPLASSVRQHQQRTACAGNMMSIAQALGVYAGSNSDAMPVAAAGWGGWLAPRDARWWSVGSPGSNSANLFSLARLGYASTSSLACAGNPHASADEAKAAKGDAPSDWSTLEHVSYSFQIRAPQGAMAWAGGDGSRIVLADRSPVVLRAVRGEVIFPMQNSPNHGGRGQNVRRADGSHSWLVTPIDGGGAGRNGNNIWLPSQIESLLKRAEQMHTGQRLAPIEGREVPSSDHDTFLGP